MLEDYKDKFILVKGTVIDLNTIAMIQKGETEVLLGTELRTRTTQLNVLISTGGTTEMIFIHFGDEEERDYAFDQIVSILADGADVMHVEKYKE